MVNLEIVEGTAGNPSTILGVKTSQFPVKFPFGFLQLNWQIVRLKERLSKINQQ